MVIIVGMSMHVYGVEYSNCFFFYNFSLLSILVSSTPPKYYSILHTCLQNKVEKPRPKRVPRVLKIKTANRRRDRGYAVKEMESLDDKKFSRMYRVNRTVFAEIVERIRPDVQRNETYAKNSSGLSFTLMYKI